MADAHSRSRRGSSCWPSQEQELVLKAALLSGGDAAKAWSDLTARTDPADLDLGTQRLLPLVWHNLSCLEGWKDHPSLEDAHNIYRRTLAENTLLLNQAALFLKDLHEYGCPFIVLKGLALVIRGYRKRGLRPMSDFDVLIPEDRREGVIDLIQSAGWTPMCGGLEKFTLPHREVVHGHTFRKDGKWNVDLHWHVLEECVWPGADADFWMKAEAIHFEGVPAGILHSSDQLFHICVHGVKWEPISTVRWVADAHVIIKEAAGNLDWERLVAQAARTKLSLPVKEALRYLAALLDAPVPAEVLNELTGIAVPRLERREFNRRTQNKPAGMLSLFPVLWYKHSRLEEGAHLLRKAWKFPRFARRFWGLQKWREVVPFFIDAAARKVPRLRKLHQFFRRG